MSKKKLKKHKAVSRPNREKDQVRPIPLSECAHLKIQYRPRLTQIVSLFLLVMVPFVCIGSVCAMYYAPRTAHISVVFWSGLFLFLASVLGFPMVVALHRLPRETFACFSFMKYFLRLKGPHLVIASYSGSCPLCGTNLNLIFNFPGSLIKRNTYFAKCNGKPEHTFPPSRLRLFGDEDKDDRT